MRIGILQAGHFPDELVPESGTYSDLYARMLDGHGFDFMTWSVVDDVFPENPEEADGWLISGSRYGAYEDLPWIPKLEAFVRDIKASDRPLVGVCFGHQVIAKALGGTVEKFDGGWSVGQQVYHIDGEDVILNAWHQDQVTRRPPEAKLVGTSDFCENAALTYGDRIYTIQPHPEFSSREIEGLIRTRGTNLPDEIKKGAAATLGQADSNAAFGHRIAQFFLESRKE